MAFIPTSQSAFALQTAASHSLSYAFPSFKLEKPLQIACSSIELIHNLFTGRLLFDKSYTLLKISSPSRPASQAFTTYSNSFRFNSSFNTSNCSFLSLAIRNSHVFGRIGRSANSHFLYLSSYTSGAAYSAKCPRHQLTTQPSPSR